MCIRGGATTQAPGRPTQCSRVATPISKAAQTIVLSSAGNSRRSRAADQSALPQKVRKDSQLQADLARRSRPAHIGPSLYGESCGYRKFYAPGLRRRLPWRGGTATVRPSEKLCIYRRPHRLISLPLEFARRGVLGTTRETQLDQR